MKDGRVGIGHLAKPSGEREFLAAVDAAFAVALDAVPLRPPAALQLHGPATPAVTPRRRRDAASRALFDHAPHGIALIDPTGHVLEVNPACARLFRLDAAALVGRPLAALPCADAALADAIEACLAGDRDAVPAHETVALRTDGRPVYAGVSGTVVRGACGAPELVALHVQDLSDLREAERAAQSFGRFDPRTGLATRDLFLDRIDRAGARASRMGTPFAVLLIDLDDFHEINAAHRRDAVIVAVADRIDDRRREVDTAARFGGALYALLLEGTSRAGALTAARGVLGLIERPVDVVGGELRVTACIGVVWCDDPCLDTATLLERAEAALDRAKGEGPGRIAEARP
ncbi:MAG: diguanylate cyclase [Deinococcus-Thermus bacterium]|nr:diguanylate cyclase [Deinococcota bacterium]